MIRSLAIAAFATLLALPSAATASEAPLSPRVRDLLARMTLEEKIGQLNMPSRGLRYSDERVAQGRIGAVLNFFSPDLVAEVRAANDRSRLKIPLVFGLDVVHGYRTIFPTAIAEAASFDPAVAESDTYWAGVEARAGGINLTFSPVADLARDPRWGRIVEGGGEDPLLAGLVARARVTGFKRAGIGTTLKHFAAYGAPEGGRDYGPVDMSVATLRDRYLPAYRMAVEAGVDVVMTSYNSLNGVPSTASRFLMSDVLRREWGFAGYVVSDMNAIAEIPMHGYAEDDDEAVRMALDAGVDQDMDSDLYVGRLADLVRDGKVAEAAIDRAAARVLMVKERLGLFDEAPFEPARAAAILATPEIRAAARAAARETFVLLKNDGATLPIPPTTATLAIIGPFSDLPDHQLGPDTAAAVHADTVTVIRGIEERAPAGMKVLHARACDVACSDEAGFDQAVATAAAADRVILFLGEPRNFAGEGGSRSNLELPGRQAELLRRIAATGKPVAVVIMAGRPLALGNVVDQAPAFLFAWYPGTEGGRSLADVLFGDFAPAGRLPVTFPRTTGQVPLTYDSLPTARPGRSDDRFTSRYVDTALGPLFPFGHGLSYTRFAYGAAEVLTPELDTDGTLRVAVTVTNTGDRPGREVVQLYVRDVVASRARPLRELKSFGKVTLAPGEARRVELRVAVKNLGFHLEDGSYVVEPGRFQAFVGPDAAAPAAGGFSVRSALKRPPLPITVERFEPGDMTIDIGSR